MSIRDDADIERLDAAMRRFYATRRRSLRWWKHAREYVALLRLVRNGLLRSQPEPKDGLPSPPRLGVDSEYRMVVESELGDFHYLDSKPPSKDVVPLPSHPPWKHQEWRWNTPDGKAPFRY